MSELRPVPAGFAQSADRPVQELARKYKASKTTIRRWIEEAGIERRLQGGPAIKARPADFAATQEGVKVADLCAHYGVCKAVVQRWLREIGVVRSLTAAASATRTRRQKNETRRPEFSRAAYAMSPKVERPFVDPSPAGQAAEFLRRFGPVVRCDEQGRYDPAGNRWRRGSSLLTADEIIDRAVRNGWTGGRMAA